MAKNPLLDEQESAISIPVDSDMFKSLFMGHKNKKELIEYAEQASKKFITEEKFHEYLRESTGKDINEERAKQYISSYEKAKGESYFNQLISNLTSEHEHATDELPDDVKEKLAKLRESKEAEERRKLEEEKREQQREADEHAAHMAHLNEERQRQQQANQQQQRKSPITIHISSTPPSAEEQLPTQSAQQPTTSQSTSNKPLNPFGVSQNVWQKQQESVLKGMGVTQTGQVVPRSGGVSSPPPPPKLPKKPGFMQRFSSGIKNQTKPFTRYVSNNPYIITGLFNPILGYVHYQRRKKKQAEQKNIPKKTVAQKNLETVYKHLGVDEKGQTITPKFSRFAQIRKSVTAFAKAHPYIASWAGGPVGFLGTSAYKGIPQVWNRFQMGPRIQRSFSAAGHKLAGYAKRLGMTAVKKAVQHFAQEAITSAAIAASGALTGGAAWAAKGVAWLANKLTGGLLNKTIDKTPLGILTSNKSIEEKAKDLGRTLMIVLTVFFVILFIIPLLFIFIIAGGGGQSAGGGTPIPGLTITLDGPITATNGGNQQLSYTVTVSCDSSCQSQGSIMIFEPSLPNGTSFGNADGTYVTSPYPITWYLNNNTPTSTSGGTNTYTFHFTLNTTTGADNTNIANIIYGALAGGTGTGTGGGTASSSDIATYAKDLALAIRPVCPAGNTNPNVGFVNGDGSCVNNIDPNFDTNLPATQTNRNAVVQFLQNDTVSNHNALQCVGFAIGVTMGVGNALPAIGNAQDYNGSNISELPGYTWIAYDQNATTLDMQSGDIVTWHRGGAGHIAVVDTVDGNNQGSAFHVYEANGDAGIFGPAGSVTRDIYHFVPSEYGGLQLQGWLRSTANTSNSGGNPSPNANTCNGKYNLSDNPEGKNFGDELCEFANNPAQAKNSLLQALQSSSDSQYADIWFNVIAKNESGYNPNAYAGKSQSGNGAWGLFQMNPTGKGNNQNDAGDVYWKQQVTNATKYNNGLETNNNTFEYWNTRPCQFVDCTDADCPVNQGDKCGQCNISC